MTFTSIGGLFLGGCPAAISWFVITIIINALQHQIWHRTFAHIIKECEEIVPAFTNLDASSTVIFIIFARGTLATVSHRFPNRIFGCSVGSARLPMNRIPGYKNVANKATAASDGAISKKFCRDHVSLSANTPTKPHGTVIFGSHPTQNSESAENLPVDGSCSHLDIF